MMRNLKPIAVIVALLVTTDVLALDAHFTDKAWESLKQEGFKFSWAIDSWLSSFFR